MTSLMQSVDEPQLDDIVSENRLLSGKINPFVRHEFNQNAGPYEE